MCTIKSNRLANLRVCVWFVLSNTSCSSAVWNTKKKRKNEKQVYFPRKKEAPPHGYNRLETTPSGHTADLNSGSGGAPIFLAYKQVCRLFVFDCFWYISSLLTDAVRQC